MPGVNPVGPYSMFHLVAEPGSTQVKNADVVVRFFASRLVGARHVGPAATVTSSIATPPPKINLPSKAI